MKLPLPNLFDFAPSELSQDAFFCWLLSHADHAYVEHELYAVARNMLLSMMNIVRKSGFNGLADKTWCVDISRQNGNIDILVIINQQWAILIESKTNSKHHSNQLQRYIEQLQKDGFDEHHLLVIYLKTGHESRHSIRTMTDAVLCDTGMQVAIFDRTQILQVLNQAKVRNVIFNQYQDYLNKIEQNSRSFLSLPIGELKRPTKTELQASVQLRAKEPLRCCAWEGFASYLDNRHGIQDKIRDWFWVSSLSGNFLAIDFKPIRWRGCYVLMAIHEHKIVFGIDTGNLSETDTANLTASRAKWRDEFLQKVADGIERYPELNINIVKRKGNGVFMKVAQVESEDWLGADDKSMGDDLEVIMDRLSQYYQFLLMLGDDA